MIEICFYVFFCFDHLLIGEEIHTRYLKKTRLCVENTSQPSLMRRPALICTDLG